MIFFKFLADSSSNIIDKDDIVNKLFPDNIWIFVTQLLAFIFMILLVIFLAYKPIKKAIQKRKEYVNNTLSDAKKLKSEAEDNLFESNKKIKQASKQADEIVNKAKKDALLEKEKQEAILKEELAKKKIDFDKQLEIEKEQALQEQKQEIVNIAMEASKSILNKNIDKKDNEKIIENFVDEIANEQE